MRKTKSLTELLEGAGKPISTVKANRKLLELGYLEEVVRESTSKPGTIRKSKRLSPKGCEGEYAVGYNVETVGEDGSPRPDLYPEYFVDQLDRLLKEILSD